MKFVILRACKQPGLAASINTIIDEYNKVVQVFQTPSHLYALNLKLINSMYTSIFVVLYREVH